MVSSWGGAARRWEPGACRPRLAGRTAELERLRRLAEDARAGLGRAVWLVGGAGVGKTRVKDALVDTVGDFFEVWEGSGLALPGTPAGVFLDLLDATRGLQPPAGTGRVSSAEAELLDRLLEGRARQGFPSSLAAERTFLVEALCHALLPHAGPRMLVLEDWHHADRFSQMLVEQLVLRIAHVPLLLIVLQRGDGPSPAPAPASSEVLTLGPLALEESAALLSQHLMADTPGPVAREALRRSAGGNPRLLLYASALQEVLPGAFIGSGAGAVYAASHAALPEGQRTALRRASILGPCFPREVMAALADGLCALSDLEAGSWLCPVAGQRFSWGAPPPAPRDEDAPLVRGLHQRAAEAYEALSTARVRRSCAEVARHWKAAGEPGRALPHLLELAGWHCAVLEPGQALAVYRSALALTETLVPDEALRWQRLLWERMGDAHRLAGEVMEAERAWRSARELDVGLPPPPVVDRLRRLQKLAAVALSRGRYDVVVALGDEGLRDAEVGAWAIVHSSGLEALAGLALCYLGFVDEAQARVKAARQRLQQVPPEEGPARASVEAALHRAAGNALMGLRRPEEAVVEYRAGLRWSERSGDVWEYSTALVNLGDAHARAGDRERAAHFFQLALDHKARAGDRWGLAYTHHGLALLHEQAGAPELAKEDAARGLHLAAMLGDSKLKSLLHCDLGRAHLRLGERGEAARQLQLAAREAAAVGARPELLQAEAAMRALESRR